MKGQNHSPGLKQLFFWLVVLTLISFCANAPAKPAVLAITNPLDYQITVSASIGEPKLTLFGYSSPSARVELKGGQVAEEVWADQRGYFLFDRVFLPRKYPELCLTSIDRQNRVSFPLCLPPLPTGPFQIKIGPVLLPPTLSLEKGNFLPGEQISAQGLTIPNASVTVFLANQKRSLSPTPRFSFDFLQILKPPFVSPAYAYSLPQYQIIADQDGRFEFNLPNTQPSGWRIFAAASYLGSPTPKSNTLSFKILSRWQWLGEKIKRALFFCLELLRPYLWQLIVLAEIMIIAFLIKQKKKRNQPSLKSERTLQFEEEPLWKKSQNLI